MPVGSMPNLQHAMMRKAVENNSPDVIIVDAISSLQVVEAAKTIAQRRLRSTADFSSTTL
jgi:stage III sporulation protein SpoIIIAA